MKRPWLIILLLLLPAAGHGQTPVGSWSDHLSYNKALGLAISDESVYVSAGAALIMYNRSFEELKKMTRTDGLSETMISSLAWSEGTGTLILGYSNTNLDLLTGNSVFNIPDIYNKYIPGEKRINRIRTSGDRAYLACSFGVVVVDLSRKEIRDTWRPSSGTDNNEVFDVAFSGGYIYAATASGVYYAVPGNQGLSYFANWNRVNTLPDPGGKYTAIVSSGERVFLSKSDESAEGDSIFFTGTGTGFIASFPGVRTKSMDGSSSGFTVSSGATARYFNTSGALTKTISSYGFALPDIVQSVSDRGDIWIADASAGLIRYENMSAFSLIKLPGPVSDNAFSVSSVNGFTVVCGGGTDESWNALGRSFQASLYSGRTWSSLTGAGSGDAHRSFIDPWSDEHLFIATWGSGLLEYRYRELVNHYDETNSPLVSIVPGRPYTRICGMAMDREKNLWITQSGVQGSLKVLSPGASWTTVPLTIDAPVIGDLIITRSGYKWILLPGGYGLAVFDDNKTPGAAGDDRYRRITVRDQDSKVISNVFSIAEDLDGSIWIGTDEGPLVYYNPDAVFTTDLKASRIKVPRNDGSGLADYLLKTESVTTLAVDGANRKWLGTAASGAYFVSSDGTTQIKNFNSRNSPLLSDSVLSVAVDGKTGAIWFGTKGGLQSYRGNATTGAESFGRVYAFPNPVRESFSGQVTIAGLMRDTNVKITDISGNLVFETVSDGGEASWDLKTYNGRYVTTGVYLVFCASGDGSASTIIKLLVIRK